MARPVTLFTGQWADLPFERICEKAKSLGFHGVELACWGDHFDVAKALSDPKYCKGRWDILQAHGLKAYAISAHLVGQAICDNIDDRHKLILPPEVWGDGDPEGVRQRAAQRMIDSAKACRKFIDAAPQSTGHPATVNGFTGSSIWGSIYAFPPTDQNYWNKGFEDFAKRFAPILAEFDKQNVNFALEVHPTEIAFDIASSQRAIDAVKGHKRFGFNFDPSHLGYQGVDYVKFVRTFKDRIFHCHMKDAWWGHGDGTVGVFGGHTSFADPRRYWDFRSLGHGDINFEEIIVALNDIGYTGPLSVEWEDSRMDREFGAARVFDVFMCHNHHDKVAVKRIARQLRRKGIMPWLDEWELQPGLPWQEALEEQIARIRSAAVFVGRNGTGPWQNVEQCALLREFVRRGCPVIPVLLPDCKETPALPLFLSGMMWVDCRRDDPDPLSQLCWGITGQRPKAVRAECLESSMIG